MSSENISSINFKLSKSQEYIVLGFALSHRQPV